MVGVVVKGFVDLGRLIEIGIVDLWSRIGVLFVIVGIVVCIGGIIIFVVIGVDKY